MVYSAGRPPVLTTIATRYYINFEGMDEMEIKSMAALTFEGKVAGSDKALGSGKFGRRVRKSTVSGFETNPSMTIEVYVNDDPMGASLRMFEWFQACLPPEEGGRGAWAQNRKSGSVIVYSADDQREVLRWNLDRAWPKKYSISDFDSTSTDLAVETYELVAERITKVVSMKTSTLAGAGA